MAPFILESLSLNCLLLIANTIADCFPVPLAAYSPASIICSMSFFFGHILFKTTYASTLLHSFYHFVHYCILHFFIKSIINLIYINIAALYSLQKLFYFIPKNPNIFRRSENTHATILYTTDKSKNISSSPNIAPHKFMKK